MTDSVPSPSSTDFKTISVARMRAGDVGAASGNSPSSTIKSEANSRNVKPLRVGIVGAGYIADFHALAIRSTKEATLVAICDSNSENATSLATAWNISSSYGSLDEMIATAEIDCVHLLVPPDLHHPLAKKALEAGLHVFLEKPMCVNVEQADDLIALAARHDRQLAVSHNFTFLPAYERMRQAVHTGALGPIDQITFQYLFELPQIQFGPFETWMLREPRNVMIETGPHLFSMLLDLIGAPDKLTVEADRAITLPGGSQVYRRWRVLGRCQKAAIAVPITPKIKDSEGYVEVKGAFLREAIQQATVASQFSDLRPELNSVLLDFSIEEMKFAATDSFRLTEKSLPKNLFTVKNTEPFRILVPLRTAYEIARIMRDDEMVKILRDENQILFKTEKTELISRLVEGAFPDYSALIPREFAAEVVLNRDEFLNAIKLAGVFGQKNSEVKIIINQNKKAIEISSADQSLGENNHILPAKIKGEFGEIFFNWRYLSDPLKAIKVKRCSSVSRQKQILRLFVPQTTTRIFISSSRF